MLHDILNPIKAILHVKDISTDNIVFKLHYKLTVFILIAASLLVTQKQYFGDPIDCRNNKGTSLDAYCWITSTFIHPQIKNGLSVGVGSGATKDHTVKHHSYYQWVTLFLYLQAICFYIPRYLWKIGESGRVKMLVSDLHFPIIEQDDKENRLNLLVRYFLDNKGNFIWYSVKYVLCELLNFANTIGQILLIDWFVGYEFTSLGTAVLEFIPEGLDYRHDPLEYVFPKLAKCNFHDFGHSGSGQITDSLCVLPLNVFNEKIFIFLWFWFGILVWANLLGLLYRIATFFDPMRQILIRAQAKTCNSVELDIVAKQLAYGDWFFLYLCGKNIDPLLMRDFIAKLSKEM